MGSQHWRGVLREREVRLHVVGREAGGGFHGNPGGRPQGVRGPERGEQEWID